MCHNGRPRSSGSDSAASVMSRKRPRETGTFTSESAVICNPMSNAGSSTQYGSPRLKGGNARRWRKRGRRRSRAATLALKASTVGRGRSARGSSRPDHATCMCAFGPSTRRKELSRAVSLVRTRNLVSNDRQLGFRRHATDGQRFPRLFGRGADRLRAVRRGPRRGSSFIRVTVMSCSAAGEPLLGAFRCKRIVVAFVVCSRQHGFPGRRSRVPLVCLSEHVRALSPRCRIAR
jgi:hypothetical protein